MKAKDYRVTSGNGPSDLAERVNRLISEGWSPLGGVCHVDGFWYQSMVNESKL